MASYLCLCSIFLLLYLFALSVKVKLKKHKSRYEKSRKQDFASSATMTLNWQLQYLERKLFMSGLTW